MMARRRWTWRAAVALGLALLLVYAFGLPAIVERIAVRRLGAMGLGPARLDVQRVTFAGAELGSIELGEESRLRIGHLSLRYALGDLLRGKIRSAVIQDASFEVHLREGTLDLGPLDRLQQVGGGPSAVPLDELAVEGARLVVVRDEQRTVVPLSATARVQEGVVLDVLVRADALDTGVTARGSYDVRDGRADVRLTADSRRLEALIDWLFADREAVGRISGGAHAEAHLVRVPDGELTIDGSLAADGLSWSGVLAGQHVRADDVVLRLEVPAEGGVPASAGETSFRLALGAGALLVGDLAELTLDVDARAQGLDAISITATLAKIGRPDERATMTAMIEGFPERPAARGRLEVALPGGPADLLTPWLAASGVALEDRAFDLQASFEVVPSEGLREWHADVTDGRLVATAARVVTATGEAREAKLDAAFAARVEPRRIVLEALEETRVMASNMVLAGTGAGIELSAVRLALRPVEDGPMLVVDGEELAGELELYLEEPIEARAPGRGAATLEDLRLGLSLADGRATVEADARGSITLGAAEGEAGTRAVASRLELDVTGSLPLDPERLDEARLDLRLATAEETGVRATWPGGEAMLGKVEATASAGLVEGKPRMAGEVSVAAAQASWSAARLHVSDVSATLPFALGQELERSGTFEAATVWLGDDLLPGLSGTLGFDAGRALVTGRWPLLEGLEVLVDGAIDFLQEERVGELTLRVPRFEITEQSQPAELLGALRGARMGGAIALDARVGIRGSRLEPVVTLSLEDVSLESEAWEASAEGVNATLVLDSIAPLSTPGGQQISIARGRLGRIEVEDGLLVFRLESPSSLLIEHTSWGWAGGYLRLYAARLDPAHPVLDGEVYVDQLDLGQLLEIFAPGQAAGSGTLYGRLPVHVAWPSISYGDGFLYAAPGEGSLQILEADTLLANVPELARRALEDLEFTALRADLEARERGGMARVHVQGRGKAPGAEQEVILDVNVDGFAELLHGAIIVGRAAKGLAR